MVLFYYYLSSILKLEIGSVVVCDPEVNAL